MSDDIFTLRVEFKDPDGCGEFAYWADTAKREALEAELDPSDEDGLDDVNNQLADDPESVSKRFFSYGEYGTVELKLKRDGTGICRLVPRSER